MNLSARGLATFTLFTITISNLASNYYKTVCGYVYSVINLLALTLFSLFKDSYFINIK